MKALVLGGGAQGSAAAYDLARRETFREIVLADLDPSLPPFLEGLEGGILRAVELDASDHDAVLRQMEGADVVLCALPYFMNLEMTRLAIEAGAHFCDLGGNTGIVEEQKELDGSARERGVSVIPDCGLAPGIVNVLAQAGIDSLDTTRAVRIYVGGIPQDPEPPLNYRIVYSIDGVLDYYTTDALVLEGGRTRKVEALTGVERVAFDGLGELEAFYTAGGISTLPLRYSGKIEEMTYKTLRYPGHAEVIRTIRDLGLLDTEPVEVEGSSVSPRRLFVEVAQPKLTGEQVRDVVALRVDVRGRKDGVEKTIRYELLDRSDEETGLTAMMRTTGFSLAIIGAMQADGRVKERGVRTPDEAVPTQPFIDALALRGIHVERTDF